MKFLIVASIVTIAAAKKPRCILKANKWDVHVRCKFPDATKISDDCCEEMNIVIGKSIETVPPTPPDREARTRLASKCGDFINYVMGQSGPIMEAQSETDKLNAVAAALPENMKCLEWIGKRDETKTGCSLHKRIGHKDIGHVEVECAIPEETTITEECCLAVQTGIDSIKSLDDKPQDGKEVESKCASVVEWGVAKKQTVAPDISKAGNMSAKIEIVLKALPSGLSCVESAVAASPSAAMYQAFLLMSKGQQLLQMSTKNEVTSPRTPSLFFVAIVAGLSGGLVSALVFFAMSKTRRSPVLLG